MRNSKYRRRPSVLSTAPDSSSALLPSQCLPVGRGRLGLGSEAESILEQCGEPLVAGFDRIAQAERGFGLQRDAPARLMEPVDRDAALGGFEGSARVAGLEARGAGSFEEVDLRAIQQLSAG